MNISGMIELLIRGLTRPREALADVMPTSAPIPAIILCVVLSYLVSTIALGLLGLWPSAEGRSPFAMHFRSLLMDGARFVVTGTVIYWATRLAGGTATRQQTFLMLGWYTLVISFLTPVMAGVARDLQAMMQAVQSGGVVHVSPVSMALGAVVAVVQIWLMAVYIASLNGFKSTWNVVGAIIGIQLAAGILFLMVGLGAG